MITIFFIHRKGGKVGLIGLPKVSCRASGAVSVGPVNFFGLLIIPGPNTY